MQSASKVVLCAAGLIASSNVRCHAQSIRSIGVAPGGTSSFAAAVSADGSILAAYSNDASSNSGRAYRWTTAVGFEDIGAPPGSWPSAISAIGSTVVGTVGGTRAFRWTPGHGMEY